MLVRLNRSQNVNKFCNKKCSAAFNNKQRALKGFTAVGKTKSVICIDCGITCEIKLNAIHSCGECISKRFIERRQKQWNKEKTCKKCNATFISKCGNYCVTCLPEMRRLAGCRSAESQANIRRSKNEILFADLCKQKFQTVKENAPIFNGWDADVVIEDIKTAVLWNGKWHYEKLADKHSVLQVQNRDKIKLNEIQKAGYKAIVIEDRGKYNPEFVQNKFDSLFLKYAISGQ